MPDQYPFLVITFLPDDNFSLRMSRQDDGGVIVEESPGELLVSGEIKSYKTLDHALSGVSEWTQRIREEYDHAAAARSEVDEFLEQFRSKAFTVIEGEDQRSAFTDSEIADLRQSLDSLKELVESQAEALKANSVQLSTFEREIESIKSDLSGMPRGVWRKVAGNKLLKSVKGFMGTPEGRALVVDGLKKLIGME